MPAPSNYPPGVSGNEYQIAGGTAMKLKRVCHSKECAGRTTTWEVEVYESDAQGECTVCCEWDEWEVEDLRP